MGKKKVRPPPSPPASDSQFTTVNTRLYREDVEQLQQQAVEAGELNWQPRLRMLVHNALAAQRRVVK